MSEVAIYRPAAEVAVPATHDTDSWVQVCSDVIKLANVICETDFVPDTLRGSAPAVAAAILAGREMGLGPMTSLQHIHIIKGKPAQSALLMRALIQAAGHKWEDGDVTDSRAVVSGCRKGESKWTEVMFTADQAKRAGIDLGKYPADKLYARATSRLARRKFADVIAGMPYSAEELEDGDLADGEPPPTETRNTPEPKRTAQRKPRKPHVDDGSQGINLPPDQQTYDGPAQPPLPPLPGEEEPDPTVAAAPPAAATAPAGPAHDARAGMIVQYFKRLGIEDRDERLILTAKLAGIDDLIGSTKDLDDLHLKRVLDALSRCRDIGQLHAITRGEAPDD